MSATSCSCLSSAVPSLTGSWAEGAVSVVSLTWAQVCFSLFKAPFLPARTHGHSHYYVFFFFLVVPHIYTPVSAKIIGPTRKICSRSNKFGFMTRSTVWQIIYHIFVQILYIIKKAKKLIISHSWSYNSWYGSWIADVRSGSIVVISILPTRD